MELLRGRGRTFRSRSYIQVSTPLDNTGPPSIPPSCLCTPRRRGPCCFVLPLFSSRQIVNGIKLEGLLGVITAALISRWLSGRVVPRGQSSTTLGGLCWYIRWAVLICTLHGRYQFLHYPQQQNPAQGEKVGHEHGRCTIRS